MAWKLNQLWDSLIASLLAGTDGLGVYVDGTGLTLAHVQKGFSGLELQHLAHLPGELGKVEEVAPALKELVSEWGLESCPVSLAVTRELGFIRRASLPQAAAENLGQVVAYELDRFLPLPGEKLLTDFQILGEGNGEIQLMLLALPREVVEVYLRLLSDATLRPISVELAPVAAANAFATLCGKLPPAWLLLHLEPGAFELTRIRGQIFQDFSRGRDIPDREMPREVMAQIDRFREDDGPQALMVYGGGSAKLKGRIQSAAPLETVYPSHFALKGLPPEADQGGALPAMGAAIRSLGKVPLAINLLPARERASVNLEGFTLTKVGLMVFLALLVLWAGSALLHKRVLLYQVNSQIDAIAAEARQVESQLEESRTLAKQMDSLRKIGQSPDKLKILKDLTQLIPDNTWLFNLRLSKQSLEISGMSKSASDLIPLLDKSGWLNKTEFASPIVTDASKLEHFKIKAEIRGLE